MKLRILPVVSLLLLIPTLATLPGCILAVAAVGAGVGYGAYTYVDGELESDLPATPPKVVAAANDALKDLQMTVISSESSAIDGKIFARTATDKSIKITVKTRSESASKIGIRIGTFGDEEGSRRILDAIKARLGIKPAPPAPVAAKG